MSNRDCSLFIVDICIAISKIERYTESFTNAQDFLYSELQWDAVIRELQIIGDAVNYLIKEGYLGQSYRRIVDFRNQIVHGYFGIDAEIVWHVVKSRLPLLRSDIIHLAAEKNIDIIPAIESAKKEYHFSPSVNQFLANLLMTVHS